MSILLAPVPIPHEITSIGEASPYLVAFVDWVEEFFEAIEAEYGNGFSIPPIFIPELIQYLRPSLDEAREAALFDHARDALARISEQQIRLHGLFGVQLQWKLKNVSHWLERFVATPGRHLLERLLDAIDAVLESILESVPGGKGIVEIKEAIRNSADIIDGEYD